jgi:membrane protease YdiL (CAAX protease family)
VGSGASLAELGSWQPLLDFDISSSAVIKCDHLITFYNTAAQGVYMPTSPMDMLLLGVVCFGLPVWSLISGKLYRDPGVAARARVRRYTLIAIRGLALSLFILLAWRRAGRPFADLGFDVPVGKPGLLGFAIALLVISYYVSTVQFRRRSTQQLNATRERLRRLRSFEMLPQTSAEYTIYPVAAIIGSACEELLYRGYLITVLTLPLGLPGAVLGSSALFGLGHLYQGAVGVVRTMIIGLAFGVGFALTHSLWWLLVAHASANLSGLFLARRIAAATDPHGQGSQSNQRFGIG